MTDRVHISKDDRSVYHTCRPTPIPAAIYCYFVKHRVHWTSPLLLINVKKLLFYCMVLPAGEFNAMSSQSHVSHCRVLPLGEFTFVIPEPHATLQSAVTWRNQCHDRATLQGVIIPSAILKIVFRHILFYFFLFYAVWVLMSGGFRIVSDTLVSIVFCRNGYTHIPHTFYPSFFLHQTVW